jgi:hypothetical protein
VKVGDLVTTDDSPQGPVGIVVELVERHRNGKSFLTAVRVLIEGEIEAFDSRDLWRFYESR